ncbi:MAG: restriction endonuclease subunit S [Pseudomonadota bacterium]
MSIREGYKQTEIGVIPEEWELLELGNVADILDPHPTHRAPKEDSNGYPFVGIGDISESGEINLSSCRKVSLEDVLEQNNNIAINENDIAFGRVATVGKVIKFKRYDFPFALSPTMALIKSKSIKNEFLFQFLNSGHTKNQFRNFTSGSTRISLGIQNLRKLLITFPPLPEQQKIAEILSTVDQKIDSIDSKIEETQTLKRGLMQRLLSEGIGHSEFKESEIGRIPRVWEVVELKKIGQIVTGSTPKTSNQEYYTNGTRLWASPSDLGKSKEVKNTANKLTDLGFEQTRILPARSILVTCIGSTIGKIGMAYEEMSTNQQINSLVCTKENSPDFYYYVLDMKKEYIKNLAGTQAVPLLNKSDFSVIKVPLPPLEEQQKIAEILSTTDEKLETLRAKKEAFKTLKKGLIQKLLSGEVRVNA